MGLTGKTAAEVTYCFPWEARNRHAHNQESERGEKGRDTEEDTKRKDGAGGIPSPNQVKDDRMVVWSGRDLINIIGRCKCLPPCPSQ